jgi:hypothetical protein
MKEDILNTLRKQDINLRDAIRQEETELPQMPADLNARLMRKKTYPQPLPVREGSGHPVVRRFWPWVAAAASLLLLIGVGLTMMHKNEQPGEPVVAEKVEQVKQVETQQTVTHIEAPSQEEHQLAQSVQAKPKKVQRKTVAKEQLTDKGPVQVEAVVAETPAQVDGQKLTASNTPKTLTEEDLPITRPENYKYTPEEIALLKRQAAEAYLKWVELELEIAKHNAEQTAQK